MRYPFFLLPLLGGAVLPAAAQAPDSATSYRHQLGLTASPVLEGLFKNNRSLPLGLLYKRQVRPTQFVRLRLIGQYSRRDTSNYLPVLPGSYVQQWQLHGYVGYEWQRALAGRWGWGYGLDVGGGLGQTKRRQLEKGTNSLGPYELDAHTRINEWQVQARPFLYLRYGLTPRLALRAETAAPLTYRRYHQRNDNTGMLTAPDGSYGPAAGYSFYKNTRTFWDWRPVQLVGMSVSL